MRYTPVPASPEIRSNTVAAACRADHREYLAVLHDTAAATLMMVGLGTVDGRAGWPCDQAGRDLELLAETDLVPMLRRLERHCRIRIRWEVAAGSLRVPQLPAVAICRAVQEALSNAARTPGWTSSRCGSATAAARSSRWSTAGAGSSPSGGAHCRRCRPV